MSSLSANISSPCINVCRINQRTGYCEGCWRNLDEISYWSQASDEYKKQVWQKIELRKVQHHG